MACLCTSAHQAEEFAPQSAMMELPLFATAGPAASCSYERIPAGAASAAYR